MALATGALTSSDAGLEFGQREFRKECGVYVTPQCDALAGHYSWPRNVFGNNCMYGVGFRGMACDKHLEKVFNRPGHATVHERVYDPCTLR